MEPFPEEFLAKIASEYELSEEQKEAFIALYTNPGKSQQDLADSLHISHNAFRTRMSGVYQKFSFGGRTPNKSRKLHDLLLKKYNQAPPAEEISTEIDINQLVAEARDIIRPDIQQRCGTMKVLDMSQPIGLGEIYTQVEILEKITASQRITLADFENLRNSDNFERLGFLNQGRSKRVDGLTAVKNHSKLMVWGKPGAGKTTFLKHLAIECIEKKFFGDRVPIFVTLKEFAETEKRPNLQGYINQKLGKSESKNGDWVWQLLNQGKVLLFLDGLDEVRREDSPQVIQEIQQFAHKFYQNHFVITCRVAAREYTFQGFTEVEVADFEQKQIKIFVNNWFRSKDSVKAKNFLNKLEENEPIQELAASPLLLTLLCLVFEEVNDFPENRAELYEEGIDVLLKKWDAKRNIERDQVYKGLSVKRKEDLLSQVAFKTFTQENYFFKQSMVENYIGEYIINLPNAKTDPEALQVDSEAVLKSIEAQHGLLVTRAKGIYSFSHLTFHEYFTAAKIVTSCKTKEALQANLGCHLTEPRWREVFLLATGMMEDATELVELMKKQVDELVADDGKIQEFLCWLNEKTKSLNEIYSARRLSETC
jgi:predicted NACHT family NTPase/DNA-binding CsgD family transcriptional regulator